MRSSHVIAARLALGLCLSALGASAIALPQPDFRINPVTGRVEAVDPVWTGSNYDIDYVVDPGNFAELQSTGLAANALDDLDPRLTIGNDGSAWVAWWRDGSVDQVLLRKRAGSSGSWSGELLVSAAGESSRKPRIATDGQRAWVAFQLDSGNQTSVAVNVIDDEPDPMGSRWILKTTSFSAVDVMVQTESGHVWVTWVDSSSQVGWAEYDATADHWNSPAYQPYTLGDVRAARSAIRALVLAP